MVVIFTEAGSLCYPASGVGDGGTLVNFCLACTAPLASQNPVIANSSYKNMLTPKIPKISNPILLTLEKYKSVIINPVRSIQ